MSNVSLLSIAQVPKLFPIFTEASVRGLISRAGENGLSAAVVRIGGRIFIDEVKFREWLKVPYSKSEQE